MHKDTLRTSSRTPGTADQVHARKFEGLLRTSQGVVRIIELNICFNLMSHISGCILPLLALCRSLGSAGLRTTRSVSILEERDAI